MKERYLMLKLLSFLFLFSGISLIAQDEYNISRYTTDNGLPGNYVLSIFQDSNGFLWFGMRGGCCRFDGFEFKTFEVKTHSGNQAINTWITAIVEDKQKNIWISEMGSYGIMKFDSDNEVFINYSDSLTGPFKTIDQIIGHYLYCDRKGTLWLGTVRNGILSYNPESYELLHLKNIKNDPASLLPGGCTAICEDSQGALWFGLSGHGVSKYDPLTKKTTNFVNNPEGYNSLYGNLIRYIFEDSYKNIWIATQDAGLNKYMPVNNKFELYIHQPGNPKSLLHNSVNCIFEDQDKQLWVSTLNGISIFNRATNSFSTCNLSESNTETTHSNTVQVITSDNTGNKWLGTSEGVVKLRKADFKTYRFSSKKNSISQNKVQYIFERSKNEIWIAIPLGIDIFNRETQSFSFLAGITKDNYGLNAPPLAFVNDNNKGVWAATYKGGLNFYDFNSKKFTYYTTNSNTIFNTKSDVVYTLFIDSEKRLWISEWGNGLSIYNKQAAQIKRLMDAEKMNHTIDMKNITAFFENKNGQILIGTLNGAAVIENIDEKRVIQLFTDLPELLQKKVAVYYFNETRNGEYLWAATSLGLIRYNTILKQSVLYTEEDGLPSRTVYGILKDSKEHLWISTTKGIQKIKPNYGKKKLSFRTYKKNEGLQGDEFIRASCCKLSDGAFVFGGTSGLTLFYPDSIKEDLIAPKLAFTALEILSKPVSIAQEINGQAVLQKSITNTKKLTLNYKNNNFTLHFVALHFDQPLNNSYSYKLIGFDNEWHVCTANDRKASYMNLPAGEYAFLLKTSNSDGVWNTEGISLLINILPPWWKSWWFLIFTTALFSSIIYLVIRIRYAGLEKQKIRLEKEVQIRTAELKEMNLILEERQEELEQMANQLHEADQSKLRFFANISHEFRTPLSLIIAPLETCIHLNEWNKDKILTYHKLMLRNAKRLLRLINQIIDFRKIDQGVLKLNKSSNNIINFVNEVIEAFMVRAEAKDIHLSLVKEQGNKINERWKMINDFWFDPDIFEKILYNLISNAIKYTPEGGEISIAIGIVDTETYSRESLPSAQLAIEISDTGIGIKPENLDKIFDRFYRVESFESYSNDGTGIGLSYTKELVQQHNGTIHAESEVHKGTSFILSFPIEAGKNGNAKKQIDDDSFNLDFIHSMIYHNEDFYLQKTDIKFANHLNKDSQYITHNDSILLVEDNTDLRNFIKNELDSYFIVLEADNGKTGLKIAEDKNPEIIVSDIMMPEMDGIEMCKKIKTHEATSHIPVILLTAKSGDQNIIEGFETGADDYITKPFNLSVLKARIINLLKQRKQLHEKFSKSSLEQGFKFPATNTIDEDFLKKAVQIIEQHIKDENFDNEYFVQEMGMSRTLIYNKIKALTGMSPAELIRNTRLKAAAQLLQTSGKTISEISFLVGFKYKQNFTRSFTELFGCTPSQYIKNTKGNV